MRIKVWNIEAITGYKPKTTFFEDFSVADHFGIPAVKDTYERGLETAMFMGYEYLTEFVMVLNHKIWEHYEDNEPLARVYNDLWQKADEEAQNILKGKELSYYYDTLD